MPPVRFGNQVHVPTFGSADTEYLPDEAHQKAFDNKKARDQALERFKQIHHIHQIIKKPCDCVFCQVYKEVIDECLLRVRDLRD